mmetsp:Transcript_108896/g.347333  ORF Transcript_108896/g.347333 Transcript_108896/m.347333 type:complete len:204 (+) Transcript_108896:75-686(+)
MVPKSSASLGDSLAFLDVFWALAGDDHLPALDLPAMRLCDMVALLLPADLLLGPCHSTEDLPSPPGHANVQDVLDCKLDPPGVCRTASRATPLLEVQKPATDLGNGLLADGHCLQRVPHRHQQLHNALDAIGLRQTVLIVAVGERELLDDCCDDAGGKYLPEEEVADDLHVGKQAVLGLLAAVLELLVIALLDVRTAQLQGMW